MKKFIAISIEGKEYMYRPKTAHAFPVSRSSLVLETLNRSRFMLKDGEKWHIYNCGGGEVYAENQSFGFRNGRLVRFTSEFSKTEVF